MPATATGPPVYQILDRDSGKKLIRRQNLFRLESDDGQTPLDQIELLTPEQMFDRNLLPVGLRRSPHYRYSYQVKIVKVFEYRIKAN